MRRFSEPQHPQPQELHDSGGTVLRRTGAAAPPFGVPRNRPMPFRVPGTHTGRRAQTKVASDSGKVPTQRGCQQHEVPPLRQRGIGKTSTDKTSTRRPPENISKTSRRRHENHRQRRGCAGETRALAARGDRWSLPRIETIRCTRASCGTRASPASESPRARRTSANAIYRANSARQARRTPQDSPRAKSILNSRDSLSAFRRAGPVQGWPSSKLAQFKAGPIQGWPNSKLAQFRAGPVQGWPNSGLAQALKTRRARLRKPSRFLEELAEFRTD